MALPGSGPISMSMVATELGLSFSNLSLRSMSNTAGKSSPDALSEFYGYSNVTYSSYGYFYNEDPCTGLYWLVYAGSNGKYYVYTGTYQPISTYGLYWYQYSFYDDFMGAYVYNVSTAYDDILEFDSVQYSYCGPF